MVVYRAQNGPERTGTAFMFVTLAFCDGSGRSELALKGPGSKK